MPQIQLGLYMISGREVTTAVKNALEVGYRAFDSAQMYGNEKETGQAILDFLDSEQNTAGLQREDIHYTTKLSSNGTSVEQVRKSITRSVRASGLGYVDLFLLHSPYGGTQARLASWRALEGAVKDGEVKSAGISNFGVRHVSALSLLVSASRRSPWTRSRSYAAPSWTFSRRSIKSRFTLSIRVPASARLRSSMAWLWRLTRRWLGHCG